MPELKQCLDIPNLDATLVVSCRKYQDTRKAPLLFLIKCIFSQQIWPEEYMSYQINWHVFIYMPGYDRRYNPAIQILYKDDIQSLLAALVSAFRRIASLENHSFPSTFSEPLGRVSGINLRLSGTNKKIELEFLMSSKTYTFSRRLNADDIRKTIATLSAIDNMIYQMANALEKMCETSGEEA